MHAVNTLIAIVLVSCGTDDSHSGLYKQCGSGTHSVGAKDWFDIETSGLLMAAELNLLRVRAAATGDAKAALDRSIAEIHTVLCNRHRDAGGARWLDTRGVPVDDLVPLPKLAEAQAILCEGFLIGGGEVVLSPLATRSGFGSGAPSPPIGREP